MGKKIGVLTFHRCINYGSYWQARCLVEGLRARGHDAVLLDHDSPQVNRAEWRCALQPLLPARVPRSERRLYASKTRMFLKAFASLPLSRRFRLEEPEALGDYDLVLIGSDEVWNLRHPWYGGRAIFYGSGLRAGRLASYAASFGNHDAADGLDGWWAEQLRGFAAISVRDENSRQLVRAALGDDPELVLDPCLQFPDAVPATKPKPAEPYVAVYGHSFPAWFRRRIRDWAALRGYRLLSIGYHNDWAGEHRITAGPEQFAQLIAGAVAVVTNFFHGCVFALLNGRPFACVPSDYRFNKVRDLARAVGAQRHLLSEANAGADYAGLLEAPLRASIGERIAALRHRSNRYLDHVLA